MPLNHFIKVWLILFIVSLSLVAFVNILIDPYALWNTTRIESLNKLKPAATTRSRLVKPHQLRNFNAKTLIMGNSRPEMGLNPDSTYWPDNFNPIYNQAIPGVNLYYQFRLMQHAAYFHKPRQIILGIDFVDFLYDKPVRKAIWPPKNDIDNLSVNLDGSTTSKYPLSVLLDQLKVTLSLDAFSDSLLTFFSQQDKFSSNRTATGFNTANDYKKIIATEGQAILFLQKNTEMIKRMNRPMHLLNENDWSQAFEAYKQLLKYTQKENLNIVVFINPYHSDYLEVIWQTGHWKKFISWKKKIAQITFDFKNVSLWDFALFNEFTTEQPHGQEVMQQKIKWFWEPAHYNKKYGDLMLAQMLGTTEPKYTDTSKPGMKVTNINRYIKILNAQDPQLNSSASAMRISRLLNAK